LKFFKLVQDGKFPLNNIAFELFLDIVEWFDKDESRQMRYSPSTIEMPGFKGKRKRGLTLTLYKKHFDIDCLYYRQGNEQKQVAVQPNLKSPSKNN
jgi:hypothetical protein